MPYILRNRLTNQIYTCKLTNHYQLAYYGTKYWDFREDAEEEAADFLREQGASEPAQWSILEVEESRMKLFNVKLKNNPAYQLYLEDDLQTVVVVKTPQSE